MSGLTESHFSQKLIPAVSVIEKSIVSRSSKGNKLGLMSSLTLSTRTTTPQHTGQVHGQSQCELGQGADSTNRKHLNADIQPLDGKKEAISSQAASLHECAHRNGEGIRKLRLRLWQSQFRSVQMLEHHTLQLLQLRNVLKLRT